MSTRDDGVRVAVLGLGNVLMGDDALGPTVLAHLTASYDCPPGVAFEDLGTPGLDLHPYLCGCEAVIIVDVVRSEGEPGELRLYRRDEILAHPPVDRVSPHDPGLKEALLSLEFAGGAPDEVLLVGVIPENIAHAVGLSPAVGGAVAAAIAAINDELHRLGVPLVRREADDGPKLWWEAET